MPEIYNRGTILAEVLVSSELDDAGDTIFGPGGNSVAVRVDENGFLQSFVNEGNLLALGGGNASSATALIDLSGTLTSIRNEDGGIWRAVVSLPTDDPFTGAVTAIDVRANTSGVSLFNAGTIIGDIYLGEGDDNVDFQDGTLSGSIEFGAGENIFSLSGTSEFTGSISHEGTLGLFVSGADLELGLGEDINVTTASFTDGATISLQVDPESNSQGSLNATSSVFVAADTLVDPDVSSFVFSETTYTFVNAGALTVEAQDLDGLLTETPFLYNTRLAFSEGSPDSLELIISPKTALELDLDPNASILYDHFLASALNPNDQVERALTGLTTREQTNDAFTAMLGDTSSASMDLALILGDLQRTRQQDQLSGFVRSVRPEQSFWAQQFATYANGTSSSEESWATDILSVGVAVGADLVASENFTWGVNGGFLLSGISRDQDVGDELSVFSPYVGAYAMAQAGGFFAGLSTNLAYHDIDRERSIAIGNVTQTAESWTNAYQFQGTFSAGYNLQAGKFSLRPTVGVNGIYYRESGYTEDGAASANLRIGSRSLSRLDAVASVSAGFDFIRNKGVNQTIVRPELFVEYSKALTGAGADFVDVGFSAATDSVQFAIDELGDTVKAGGAALRFFGAGADGSVRYTYREKDFVTSHEATLHFSLQF